MQNTILPIFLLAALELGFIVWIISRRLSTAAGRTMKEATSANGQRYFFSQRRYGKYKGKSIISAGVAVQNGFVFSICRRTFWHRFLTPLGLAQDIKTGDALLDDTFYFMADDNERLKTLLGSSGFTAALHETFETCKARTVEGRQNKVSFDAGPINDMDINEEACAGQAAKLAAAVENLEATGYIQYSAALPPSRLAFLFNIGHMALVVLGVIAAATLLLRSEDIINKKEFFIEAAAFTPIVLLLWLTMLMTIFGKTSWFPQVCGGFIVTGIAGLALLTGFAMREVNIDLDTSQPEIKFLRLEAKNCSLHCSTGGKNARTTDYALSDRQCSPAEARDTLASYRQQDYKCRSSAHINYTLSFPWPVERTDGDAGKYMLAVQASNYEQAHQGEAFSFPIHKGALGLAWIRKADIHGE